LPENSPAITKPAACITHAANTEICRSFHALPTSCRRGVRAERLDDPVQAKPATSDAAARFSPPLFCGMMCRRVGLIGAQQARDLIHQRHRMGRKTAERPRRATA
jgi:hypothetical protein